MKESILYKILRPVLTFIFKVIYRPTIIGKENISTTGRIILAGTHTHILDCILLMCCTKRPIHFLAKAELMKGPKKIIFANMGLIPVHRERKDPNSLIEARKYLNNDMVIGIFPEGTTRKKKNTLLPFKIGAVRLASDTNSMIVPFTINHEYIPFKKSVEIIFDKPISIKNDLEKENELLKSIIEKNMEG